MGVGTYKIVLIGSSGVGKTAVVQRFVDDYFGDDFQSTVGVEFKSTTVVIEDETIRLSIWDTAGQERYRSISKAYFRNAVGAILVFSVDNDHSFNDLEQWVNDFYSLASPNAVVFLIGNKIDMVAERKITENNALAFAERHDIEYLETSAKDSINIEEVFVRLTRKIHQKVIRGEITMTSNVLPIDIHETNSLLNKNKNISKGCC